MDKKQYWTIGGVALLLVGVYIVYDSFFKKKEDKVTKPNKKEDGVLGTLSSAGSTITSSVGGVASNIVQFVTTYNDYIVTTQKTGLNVRQKPDINSKIITSLPSGSTILAKASGNKGWLAVSKDGDKLLGYVSQEFLKIKK